MKTDNFKIGKRYQTPCLVDGKYFSNVLDAWQYLEEVNGRINLDRLERHLRQGRKVIEGHIITAAVPHCGCR